LLLIDVRGLAFKLHVESFEKLDINFLVYFFNQIFENMILSPLLCSLNKNGLLRSD